MEKLKSYEDFINQINEEKIEVNTRAWTNSTGKSIPSGTGLWAFFKDKECSIRNGEENIDYIFINGKYSDAKKKAEDWAKKHGYKQIYVGS